MLMPRKHILIYIFSAPFALFLFIFFTNTIVHLSSSTYIYEDIAEAKEKETALVLGAAVYSSGNLSPVYQKRVDKALELYEAGKVSKILASGDNSAVEYNEVNPVRNYLLAKGVPNEDIYLDHAGFDTYSTMYRARDIFEVSSVIVVTQSFHLPRAIFIARALGIDAHGVSADEDNIKISNYIREVFANEKALINVVFHRQPKYLGDTIPIGEEREEPTSELPIASGYVSGHIDIGPFCPIEIEGQTCEIPPEAYTSREVIIYESDQTTINVKGSIDAKGNYRIPLGPGKYFVQINPAGIGPGEKKQVTIKSFETTIVNFNIDTGIR
jgi:SanA protein